MNILKIWIRALKNKLSIFEDEDIDKLDLKQDNINKANKKEEKDNNSFANLLGNSLDEYVNSIQGMNIDNEYENDLTHELKNDNEYDTIKTSSNMAELAMPYSEHIIPNKIKDYLSRLQNYGEMILVDSPPSFNEISLMSRQTGTEFASITIGAKHYIIKGDIKGTPISKSMIEDMKRNKGILNCHSHPFISDLRVSDEDVRFAKILNWQNEFYVISPDGQYCTYNSNGILSIRNIEKLIEIQDKEFYEKLFKE